VPSAMVRRTEFWYARGVPLETQSALLASPRYSVFGTTPSRLLNWKVWLLHTGAGTHELRVLEFRGSQPPRQYAPTPHWPYSV
jgi:hypothetical protein